MTNEEANAVRSLINKACEDITVTMAKEVGVTKENVEEYLNCADKQIPQKPNVEVHITYTAYMCPSCGLGLEGMYPYCSECGQAIDWSEVEE